MTSQSISELRKIRNEIVHSGRPADLGALAARLSELGLSIPPGDLPELIPVILRGLDWYGGFHQIPTPLAQFLPELLKGRSANIICDPWAGLGEVLSIVQTATNPARSLAFATNEAELRLSHLLVGDAHWRLGNPLELLASLETDFDVVASILPFGAKSDRSLVLPGTDGKSVELRDDLGPLILAAAAAKLNKDGIGLFVLPPSFFFSQRSVLRHLPNLGVSVEAAFALPAGSFAPYTNISTYLIVVRKRPAPRMFVGQISSDVKTNHQLLANYRDAKEGASLELGRMVDPLSFTGLEAIRTSERLSRAQTIFDAPAVRLEELATAVNLGRFGEDFEFPKLPNTVFVPLIGTSDVVESLEELRLKKQNYAQVAIDPARSNARFVAQFLNSEFGKELREMQKSGAVIPKLNKQTLKALLMFLPDLRTQHQLLEVETRIAAEQNTLSGLQNELGEFRRELWANPTAAPSVSDRLTVLSGRLSASLKEHAAESLDQWFETLPFPLASILRAWQATPSHDFKTRHEHLLHFFEATAEFISVILLSAFSSNESLFVTHKQKLRNRCRNKI